MNVENRTLFIADNLEIMRGIDSETIDLIYLDPPFNTKKEYKAPIGSPGRRCVVQRTSGRTTTSNTNGTGEIAEDA